MSRISKILLKHKVIQSLPYPLIGFILYELGRYMYEAQDHLPGWSLFLIWFAINYGIIAETTEFWIHPQFQKKIDEILQAEGFVLKCEEGSNKLNIKKRKYWRIHHARIEHEGQHLVLKVSGSYSERMASLITNDMLYGKKRRHIFSQNEKTNVPEH